MFSFWHQASNIFDEIYKGWTGQATMRALGTTMVTAYITILVLIGLARQGMLPGFLVPHMPTRYFYAVNIVFTLLLYIELIDLILGLSYSVSRALAKQFEIFSMILLRQSFKEFSNITPPINWSQLPEPVFHILSASGGALAIFIILLAYYRMLCHHPISPDEKDAAGFIRAKKTIALLLLMFFLALEGYSFLTWLRTGQSGNFFVTFYTALVFSDILLVLLSLRYGIRFPVVFRNSGYALATVFLRVALTAPPYVNALIGICAGLYVLVINVAYNGYAALDRQC